MTTSGPTFTQAVDFCTHGYTILRMYIPQEEMTALRVLYDLAIAKVEINQGQAKYDKIHWIPRAESLVPDFITSQPYRRAQLFAANVLGLDPGDLEGSVRIFDKPAQVGAAIPWHQDEAYHLPSDDPVIGLSFWVPFCNVDRKNGCLLYVPGSHLGHVRQHHSDPADFSGFTLKTNVEDDDQVEAAIMSSGDVCVHHIRTLHCSGANRSQIGRPALSFVFPKIFHSRNHKSRIV